MTLGYHDNPVRAGAGVERPRYAQLFYTSWDDGSGSGGGWQVKEEVGELTRSERDELTARVVTRFDVGEPLPTFPTPDQIAVRPARLSYGRVGKDAGGYWHTVDAGKDATGRPGNVAAHAVLDRQLDAVSAHRPIQLWGSPEWLRPYGATEVTAAVLPHVDHPAANPAIIADAVVAFLTATMARLSVFRVLLDAVAAALSGGRRVVVATTDLDSGVHWIAALSFFMSPGTARRLWWSTYDDPSLAVVDLRRGVHLVVVGRDRVAELPTGPWVVLDETAEPGLGALGGTHPGTEIVVTAWSVLAEGVLADEMSAARLLADQDRVAAEVGDVGLSPVWPLAIAVRCDEELSEFHRDADQVIVDEAPRQPISSEWISAVVTRSTAATAPTTAAEAYRRLVAAHERGYGVAGAARRLLQIALSDPGWLTSAEFDDVPQVSAVEIAEAPQLTPDTALRAAELVTRLGVPGAELRAAQQAMSEQMRHWLPGALIPDTAIGAATLEDVLRPAVATLPAEVLDGLSLPLWRWLFGDGSDGLPAVAPNPREFDRALVPRYAIAALDDPEWRTTASPQQAAQLATDAIFLALDADGFTDEQCRVLVSRLTHHVVLPATDLQRIFTEWPSRVVPGIAVSCIYFEPASADFLELVARLGEKSGGWDWPTVAAARLRALTRAAAPWLPDELAEASRCAPVVLANIRREHLRSLAPDLADILVALIVADRSRGVTTDDPFGIADELVSLRVNHSGAVEYLGDLAAVGVLDVDWLFGQALLARIASAIPELNLDTGGVWAGTVAAKLSGRRRGPSTVAEVRDACWPHIRGLSAEAAEAFFAGYADVAREWLSDNGTGDVEKPRFGFGRFS